MASERDEFTGFHVTKQVKEALRLEAIRQRVSLSFLLSSICEQWLERVAQLRSKKNFPANEIDVPLPFED